VYKNNKLAKVNLANINLNIVEIANNYKYYQNLLKEIR